MKHRGLSGMLRLVAITVAVGLSATYDVYSYQWKSFENHYSQAAYSREYVKYDDYRYSLMYGKGQYTRYGSHRTYVDYTNAANLNGWEYGKTFSKTYRYTYPSYQTSKVSGWTSYTADMFQPDAYRTGGTYYGFSHI